MFFAKILQGIHVGKFVYNQVWYRLDRVHQDGSRMKAQNNKRCNAVRKRFCASQEVQVRTSLMSSSRW